MQLHLEEEKLKRVQAMASDRVVGLEAGRTASDRVEERVVDLESDALGSWSCGAA